MAYVGVREGAARVCVCGHGRRGCVQGSSACVALAPACTCVCGESGKVSEIEL